MYTAIALPKFTAGDTVLGGDSILEEGSAFAQTANTDFLVFRLSALSIISHTVPSQFNIARKRIATLMATLAFLLFYPSIYELLMNDLLIQIIKSKECVGISLHARLCAHTWGFSQQGRQLNSS